MPPRRSTTIAAKTQVDSAGAKSFMTFARNVRRQVWSLHLRRVASLACFAFAAVVIVACGGPAQNANRLGPVAALPQPQLPAWIASISPTGKADTLAQIRIIFTKPVAPVTALSGPGPQDVVSRVEHRAGSARALRRAHAANDRLRRRSGAADWDAGAGHAGGGTARSRRATRCSTTSRGRSKRSRCASRTCRRLTASDDESTPPPVSLRPTLSVTSNAAVDASSLAATPRSSAATKASALRPPLKTQPTPYPGSNAQELFDPSLNTWTYRLRPVRDLRRATTYALQIDPGVAPQYGNVPTSERFSGAIRTYDALAIVPTAAPSPNCGGRFARGDPVIAFSNPLDPKSIAGQVTISPAPAAVKTLVSVPDQSNEIAIDPYALDPNATYTATIGAGVKDMFGQALGSAQQVTIRTSDFAPGAWAPTGTTIIPAGAPIALNFYATNLPANAYQAAYARVDPQQLLGFPAPLSMLPAWRGWPSRTLAGARTNAQSVVRVPLRDEAGGDYGAFAYGFRTALDSPTSDPWLTRHRADHEPRRVRAVVPGARHRARAALERRRAGTRGGGDGLSPRAKTARRRRRSAPRERPTRTASSISTGVDVERCSVGAQDNNAPNVGVVVTEGTDVATVTAWNYSGVSRFDVYGGWTSGAPLSRGTIFTDRQMYQPGERGELTGLAYYVKGNQVVADANAPYKVTLTDPSNNASPLGQVRTDAFGIFSLPIVFSKQQTLGYYGVNGVGLERKRDRRLAARRTVQAAELQADADARSEVRDGGLERARRRRRCVPLRRAAAGRHGARVCHARCRDGAAQGLGRLLVRSAMVLPGADAVVRHRRAAEGSPARRARQCVAGRRGAGKPTFSDDVSRRHGDERRLEPLRRRLAKFSRAGIGRRDRPRVRYRRQGRHADGDPHDRYRCRRQSRSRAAACTSSCRR